MKIIKLNAIDSTNSFLKDLVKNSAIESFTVVTANKQTKGRGQQNNNWVSEAYKNLTISVFIKNLALEISNQRYLNFAVSLAVFDVINANKINDLTIKWPNDIMSANNKICGILIENITRRQNIHSAIIGIGLNVNQVIFPDFLKSASSLKLITGNEYDLDILLTTLIVQLKKRIATLIEKQYNQLENDYLQVLYKKNIPTMFIDSRDNLFMGKIIGISMSGNLQIELEDETVKEFGIKEISLAR